MGTGQGVSRGRRLALGGTACSPLPSQPPHMPRAVLRLRTTSRWRQRVRLQIRRPRSSGCPQHRRQWPSQPCRPTSGGRALRRCHTLALPALAGMINASTHIHPHMLCGSHPRRRAVASCGKRNLGTKQHSTLPAPSFQGSWWMSASRAVDCQGGDHCLSAQYVRVLVSAGGHTHSGAHSLHMGTLSSVACRALITPG